MKSGWQATDEQIAVVYSNTAFAYNALGEKEKALEYYEQALRLMRAVGDREGEGATLNNLGRVYDDLGEKEKALEYYEQALRLTRAVGDRGGEGATLNNLGGVYDDLGEKEKALEYFEQALHIHKAVRNPAMEGITLHNIGMVYLLEWHDLMVGVACILLAKKLFEKVQSPNVEVAVEVINSLRQALGEEQIAQLLAQIEPRAQQIVDEALSKP